MLGMGLQNRIFDPLRQLEWRRIDLAVALRRKSFENLKMPIFQPLCMSRDDGFQIVERVEYGARLLASGERVGGLRRCPLFLLVNVFLVIDKSLDRR